MKLSLTTSALLISLAIPAAAQTTGSATKAAPVFEWRLNLLKGQSWTQNLTSRATSIQELPAAPGAKKSKFELDINQNLSFKNVVVDVTPTYYLVRITYTRFGVTTVTKIDGKIQKTPNVPKPNFVGLSFSVKQAPDGRILDVMGLESLMERQQKALETLAKTPSEKAMFRSLSPSADLLKKALTRNQSLALPKMPLGIGDSYTYALDLPVLASLNFSLKGKRTLLSFNSDKAIFSEGATLSVPPSPMMVPEVSGKTVTLTGDAAKFYLMQNHRVSPTATAAYLSKNGRVYYRNAQNPKQVIWVEVPTGGIKIKESEAAAYGGLKGYNGQSSGLTVAEALDAGLAAAVTGQAQAPKIFVTLKGDVTGTGSVDVLTGLPIRNDAKIVMKGKVTVVDPQGIKHTVPLLSTSQTTLTTE